jgi:hypothetical protein
MKKLSKVVAGLSIAAAFGAAVLPLGAYAAGNPAEEIVSVTVADTLFLAVSNEADEGMTTNHTNITTLADTIFAGSSKPYNLTIAAKTSADTNLTSGANKIVGAATVATDASANSYTWGIDGTVTISTDGNEGITSVDAWALTTLTAPTTSATPIATSAPANDVTEKTGSDVYGVRFGIKTANNQADGEYTATNVYTLTVSE